MTVDDIRKKFLYGFSYSEIVEIFNENNKLKDGKLKFQEFLLFLLPPEYIIDPREMQAEEFS